MKSGKSLKEFRGHTSYVNTAVYSRDQSKVVTASSDGLVIVFDAKTTEELHKISPPPPPHTSSAMQFSVNSALFPMKVPTVFGDQEGELFFVCSRTNTLHLMNLSGQVLKIYSSGKREKGDFVAMLPSPK